MKTRKILPLVLLAVVALFALSSCDQLLDAIFPNDNTFNLYVPVAKLAHLDWTYSTVTVSLYNGVGTLVSQEVAYATSPDGTYGYFYFSFSKLAKGTYTIYAYYAGGVLDSPAATIYFQDPNTFAYISSISLPDSNPGDPSGKTVTTYTQAL